MFFKILKNTYKTNLYIISFIALLNSITLASIIPILYSYATRFGLSDFEVGLLFATFSLAQFIATPIIGRLSDQYGRKPLLVISLLGTFLACILQAFAWNAWILFLGRFIDGITGGNNSVAQAVISDCLEEKDKPTGFAIFGASLGLGFLIGPLISIILSKNFSDASIFLFSALLAMIAILITQFGLAETNKTREPKKINLVELFFLQNYYAFKKEIIREILIINFLTALSFAVFQIAFQPYIFINFGWGQDVISYVLITIGLISILFIRLVKSVTDKLGLNKTLIIVFLLRCFVFILLGIFINPIIFWLSIIIFGFANLFSRPVISSILANYANKEDQGVALGAAESLFSLGLVIGPALFALFSKVDNKIFYPMLQNYSLHFYLTTIISLIALVYAIKLYNQTKRQTKLYTVDL